MELFPGRRLRWWAAYRLVSPLLLIGLAAALVRGTLASGQSLPTAFHPGTKLPKSRHCARSTPRHDVARVSPTRPESTSRIMATRWRWDFRTGKEIGGDVRDLMNSTDGDVDDGKLPIVKTITRLIQRPVTQVAGAVLLAAGGLTAVKKGGVKLPGVRMPNVQIERFLQPKGPMGEEGQDSAVPLKDDRMVQGEQEQQQPPPEEKGMVVEEGSVDEEDTVEDKRKRWTPFANLRRKVVKPREELKEVKPPDHEAPAASESTTVTKDTKGEEPDAGREDKVEKPGDVKVKEEEGAVTIKIQKGTVGSAKAKRKNRESVGAQSSAAGGAAGKGETKSEAKQASPPAAQQQEKAPEGKKSTQEEDGSDAEEEGETEKGETGADILKEWSDRRGAVLLNGKIPKELPVPLFGDDDDDLDVTRAPITIPPTSAVTKRPGSSFVASVYRSVGPAVPRVDCVKLYKNQVKFASGSGVIFTPDGYVVTNSLLVRNALELKVTLSDGHEYPAELKGLDEVLDVAVLKIKTGQGQELPKFEYAPIGDSDVLQVGDWVMSMGSPKNPGPSVILGIVSGLTRTAAEVGRPETQVSFIQTDASFDAGVVGGPLLNEYGEVVGINSIGMTTSSTVQFSVPINQIRDAITELANGRAVVHPSIGVEMMPITPSLAARLNGQAKEGQGIQYIPEGGAVVVVNVLEDSPAYAGGLQTLDILLEIESRPIYNVEDAQKVIKAAGVGRDLEIKVLRKNQEVTLRVTTTDFLSLITKHKPEGKYPEMKRRREKGGMGREGGSESSQLENEVPREDGVVPREENVVPPAAGKEKGAVSEQPSEPMQERRRSGSEDDKDGMTEGRRQGERRPRGREEAARSLGHLYV